MLYVAIVITIIVFVSLTLDYRNYMKRMSFYRGCLNSNPDISTTYKVDVLNRVLGDGDVSDD